MNSSSQRFAAFRTGPLRIATVVPLILSAALAARAHAQAPPAAAAAADSSNPEGAPLQEVVVTGTQIHGVSAPIGSSLVVVGQDEIQQSGLQTTADVIRSLPFVSGIGPGEDLTNSAANLGTLNITRAQGIDIRGLGVQATLTLLDGRRVVPGGEGAQLFDPSNIPAIALDRVEIVPDGASATYGTDAIAGVVNLLLRKNFKGVEVQVSDGWASGFSNQVRVGAIAGTAWDSGSIMVAGEFFTHPQLLATDRPTLYNDNQTAFGGSDLRNLVGAPGNITYNGVLQGLPAGNGVGVMPASFSSTVNKTSQWAYDSAIPPVERHSFVLSAQQRVAENVNVWVEGYYSERRGVQLAQPLQKTGIQVPSTNPFFIAGAAAPCQSGVGLCDSVNYSFINDLGPERITIGETSNQLAAGVDVGLGHDFNFELYGTTNHDSEIDLFTGLNTSALNTALADPDPSTALNVMGSGGNNNAATLQSILGYSNYTSRYDLDLLNAKLDGPVFALPGGPVRVAVGTEYHHDRLHNYNYGDVATPSTSLFQTTVLNTTERTVASGYVEAVVPFFGSANSRPGLQRLELDVAGRYDHYSDFGSTTNPKIGIRWDPIQDLTTHASFGRSFRAPTLCDASPYCTAGLIVIPFPDLGWKANNPPSIFGPGVSVTAIEVGGREGIKPETATTYSAGLDWHPASIQTLDVSVDYYHIDYKNIIDAPAAFNPAAGLDPAFAPFVIRNPTLAQTLAVYNAPTANGGGAPSFPPFLVNLIVDGRRQNVGEALTDGLDIAIKKSWESPIGTWLTAANATYVLKYNYSLVPGAPLLDVLNTVQGSGNAYPLRFQGRAQFGWQLAGFGANAFVNYHNSYTNTAPPPPLANQSIASYTTVDLTVGYDTGDSPGLKALRNLSFSVSAIDLFNTLPPFALIGTQDFDGTTGTPLGRLVTVQLRKRF